MAKKTTQTTKVYRRADNGQFTSPEFVKKHPKITVTETRPTKKK